MRYQGGKSRIAKPLAQIITTTAGGADCFVSLFCGSCAVESKVQGFSRKILNDRHKNNKDYWLVQGIGSTVVYGRDRERRKSRHFTQEQQAERYLARHGFRAD